MGVIVVKLPSDQMLDHLDKVVVRLVKSMLPKGQILGGPKGGR